MKKFTLLLLTLMVSITSISWAQKQVEGVIYDDLNVPLSGANILIKGTTNGVSADFDGVFKINAKIGDILEISFLGMKTKEVLIENYNALNIVLEADASQLDDIVIVGYGSQKRSDVTGSIASIKKESFNKGIATNPGQLLQGKVAGVNVTNVSGEPGASQNIVIRGVGSLRTGTTPLYVVDGFALDNTGNGVATNPLNFINSQDIESIDVLKDASAAAIYGARAANGVIVITTKKGQKGKTQMNLNLTTGISNLASDIDVFSADEFRKQVVALGGTLDDQGANTNWQEELTRTAISKNLNLSLSGGTNETSYFASIGSENQDGILRNNNLKRQSGRFNLTQKGFENRFKVEFNLAATRSENSRANSRKIVSDMITLNPTIAPYTNGEPTLIDNHLNPLTDEKIRSDKTLNHRILANIAPSIEFIKGLTYKLNLGVDYSYSERDLKILPYALNPNSDEIIGGLNSIYTNNKNTLVENTLTYNVNKGNHDITVLAGHSYQETYVHQKNYNLYGFNDNGIDPIYQDHTSTDDPDKKDEETTLDTYATTNELQSFFGRVNYGYANKYLITATVRADGSSKFGDNKKYGYFPSVALGWNISKEDFMTNSIFNNLKLRASWGQTGNQEIPSKITRSTYKDSKDNNDTYPLNETASTLDDYPFGSIYTRLANPELQWEVSTQTNIGLDFSLLDNAFTGSIDYFNKISDNVILYVDTPDPIQPTEKYWTNIDGLEIQNSGIEIALDYKNIINNFTYNIGGNISFINNKVKNSPYKVLKTGAAQGSGQTDATINGIINNEAIGAFYMQEFLGIGDDGLSILSDDRKVVGNALPDFTYAFYLNFNYKNFDLGLNFNGVSGNDIFNHVAMSNYAKGKLASNFNTTGFATQYDNESVTNSNIVSTRYLENGSFLRLNNATLGYNLKPKTFGLGDIVQNIRFSITGQNLFTITKYSGFDPEINSDLNIGDIQTFGIDYYNYPKSRSFVFGLNVTF